MTRLEALAEALHRNNVPEHLHGGLERWLQHGIIPGSFLTAVLENDLKKSLELGDSRNIATLHQLVSALWQELPSAAWGSPERVNAWAEHHGLEGLL